VHQGELMRLGSSCTPLVIAAIRVRRDSAVPEGASL
jgi:hypothetical protein